MRLWLLFLAAGLGWAARVEYVGGTLGNVPVGASGSVSTTDNACFLLETRRATVRIPYENINGIEYGQKVSRRYAMAVLISPMFLMSKSRRHFLSVEFKDAEGRQQAIVLKVDKDHIRAVLVGLEARTGHKVRYQDDEARKAGKG